MASPQQLDQLMRNSVALHQSGDLNNAENGYRQVLKINPKHPDALHLLGILQHQKHNNSEAEKLINKAIKLRSNEPMFYFNLGNVLNALHKTQDSLYAFNKATQLNPKFSAAWSNLASRQYDLQRYSDAIKSLDKALALNPQDAISLNLKGVSLNALNQTSSAIENFQAALDIHQDYVDALINLGRLYYRLDRSIDAEKLLLKAKKIAPENSEIYIALFWCYLSLGRADDAEQYIQKAIQQSPDNIITKYAHGYFAILSNKKDEGIKQLESIADEPSIQGMVWQKLVQHNIEQYDIQTAHRLAKLINKQRDSDNLVGLCFAAANLFQYHSHFDEAFQYFKKGNEYLGCHYDSGQQASIAEKMFNHFTPEFITNHKSEYAPESTIVHILGVPRSGTTLLETILGSHPEIKASGENSSLLKSLHTFEEQKAEEDIAIQLSSEQVPQLVKHYIADMQEISGKAKFITNKTLFLHHYIGLLAYAMPTTKFIYCQRSLLDTAVSSYMIAFQNRRMDFSNDLRCLGQFLNEYQRVMAHWHNMLPGNIHIVRYEELVESPKETIEKVLSYIGLPWSDACLDFYKQKNIILTASNTQANQAIYRKSLGRWKNYAKHLQPLIDELAKSECNQPAVDEYWNFMNKT